MIRPRHFGFNVQTASSNAFQTDASVDAHLALQEFDKMVDVLRAHEVNVEVIDDSDTPVKPDAIFPNNWLSTHETGEIVLYSMMAENRRLERRADIIDELVRKYHVTSISDLSKHERAGQFLEGTGSIVFDHPNKLAYACRSPRTDEKLLQELCRKINYEPVVFDAFDNGGKPIYHTNVMMSIGEDFALLCLDSIRKDEDQEVVLGHLSDKNHKVVSISYDQMKAFAGNTIEVKTNGNDNVVLMSTTAFNSLLPGQLNAISQFADVLPISVPTIERIGGGGVRCMVAGIHLPLRKMNS